MEEDVHPDTNLKHDQGQAATHVAGARQILKSLQEKIGENPEIGQAITKLEMALNILAIETGGLL